MNQIPNIEETHNTIDDVKMEILAKKVHEWLRSDGDSVFFDSLACANYVHHQLQKAREELLEEMEVFTFEACPYEGTMMRAFIRSKRADLLPTQVTE